ncbi:MAG: DUF4432 family protein [Planctomycetota bacterium]
MKKNTKLVVLGSRTSLREGAISSQDLGLAPGGKVTVRTLHGGREAGVVDILVSAGDLSLSILPTRGMGIWWAKYKGKSLFWKSPVREAVHPAYVHLERNGGLGWLDGFCEGLVRCGLGWHGAPGEDEIIDNFGNVTRVRLPLHGQIANIPASEVEIEGCRRAGKSFIVVRGVVREEGVFLDKYELATETLIDLEGAAIRIHDEVTNTSRERTSPLEMLYHINFGPPALASGSRMVFSGSASPRDARAAEGIASQPLFAGKTRGFTEQVYWIDLDAGTRGDTGTMLVNAKGDFAVYELHDKKQLKCFAHWKQTGADEYATGFEPGTSLPNNRGVERKAGRLEFLAPGETRAFDLVIGALDSPRAIRAMEKTLKPRK